MNRAVRTRVVSTAGLVLAGTLLAGCAVLLVGAGAGAGVGTYAYVNGELKHEVHASLDRTWAATSQAVRALELRVVESHKDQLGGKVEARRADGKPVKIALESEASDRTVVRIRIGTFGDESGSEQIAREIDKRL